MNVDQRLGFPAVTPIRVPGFYKDAFGDARSDNIAGLEKDTNTVYNMAWDLNRNNWGQGDFVQADIQASAYSALGLDSSGTAYYFSYNNENEIDRDRYEIFSSWCDGAFPPVSGSPNWPAGEISRNPTPIASSYFNGKKIKQLQLIGLRYGGFALTEFYPELDAFTPQSLNQTSSSFTLSLTGRYLRPNDGNMSNVEFRTSAPNLACSIGSLTYISASVSCVRNDSNNLQGTIYGYFVRDGVAALAQSIIAIAADAPSAAVAPNASPQSSPDAPQAISTVPTSSTTPQSSGSVPVAAGTAPNSQSAPNQAVSLSTSFIFNSTRDLNTAALDATKRVLCEVATNITARSGISCDVRAVISTKKRAAGLHNATLTSVDAPTAAAVLANIGAIQTAFTAAITLPMAPTTPISPSRPVPSSTPFLSATDEGGAGRGSGLAIGVGVGVAVFVIIVIVVAIVLYRRKQALEKTKHNKEEMRTVQQSDAVYSQPNVIAEDSSSSASSSASSSKEAKKSKKPKKKVSQSSSDSDGGDTSAESAPDGLYGALPASDAQLNHKKRWITQIFLSRSLTLERASEKVLLVSVCRF